MSIQSARRSPLAMAVLLMLAAEPLHPYGLRQRIRDWGKDEVVNVSQGSVIYQTIERLTRAGLIAAQETTREERRPERTIYSATPEGVALGEQWLVELLSTPVREYPEFAAALAFLSVVPPEVRLRSLETRVKSLEENIARLKAHVDSSVAEIPGGVDRIYLVEIEYLLAIWAAELTWVNELVDDIRNNRLG